MTPSMETWAPTIIFRMGHAPGLSLGRTTCFRSLSRHYALCHGGGGCGGGGNEVEAEGDGGGGGTHPQPRKPTRGRGPPPRGAPPPARPRPTPTRPPPTP